MRNIDINKLTIDEYINLNDKVGLVEEYVDDNSTTFIIRVADLIDDEFARRIVALSDLDLTDVVRCEDEDSYWFCVRASFEGCDVTYHPDTKMSSLLNDIYKQAKEQVEGVVASIKTDFQNCGKYTNEYTIGWENQGEYHTAYEIIEEFGEEYGIVWEYTHNDYIKIMDLT